MADTGLCPKTECAPEFPAGDLPRPRGPGQYLSSIGIGRYSSHTQIMMVSIYLWVRRKYSLTVAPILSMRLDGLEIHSLHYDMYIPWSEIDEVRPFTIFEPGLTPKL
jgi:hypothetical protein